MWLLLYIEDNIFYTTRVEIIIIVFENNKIIVPLSFYNINQLYIKYSKYNIYQVLHTNWLYITIIIGFKNWGQERSCIYIFYKYSFSVCVIVVVNIIGLNKNISIKNKYFNVIK